MESAVDREAPVATLVYSETGFVSGSGSNVGAVIRSGHGNGFVSSGRVVRREMAGCCWNDEGLPEVHSPREIRTPKFF